MLSDDQIAHALHASRVVTLPVCSPHGPLGMEQLAETVKQYIRSKSAPEERVQRPIALPVETWEKLDQLARAATPANTPPLSASAVAAVLLEQAVTPK